MTILLNGRHLVWNHDVDQSSTGRLSLVLSSHSLGEWRRLVCYQVVGLGSSPWLRHLVCYQEGTISPRLGLGMCDTLTLDLWALCTSPRLSYPWLSFPSTRSRCHTECEIKALVTLLVYNNVLLESKGAQVMTTRAT